MKAYLKINQTHSILEVDKLHNELRNFGLGGIRILGSNLLFVRLHYHFLRHHDIKIFFYGHFAKVAYN